ncbi:MAG: hypothetical protein EOO60_13255 [Hymenobacter sp.]|nr:MAG: hypothetical protein EOO60_13255 [Hymenobacter sp.]
MHNDQLQSLLATHADHLQALLPTHFWPISPFEVKQFGPLTKYTLGQMPDGRWAHLHYLSSPDEGDMHDHPCDIESIGIKGSYLELRAEASGIEEILRRAGERRIITADCIHIIEWVSKGGCWTLCLTGPVVRQWRHYPELVAAA